MQSLTDLVGEIYEAAYNPGHWAEVFRILCVDVLNAKSAAIMVDDYQLGTRTILGHYGLPKMAEITYNLGLARYDYAFKLQEKVPEGLASQIIDHREARITAPMYYRMILKPVDLGYIAGLTIFRNQEWHAGLGVHRGFAAQPFGQSEIGIIQQLFPHLQRAIRIHKEFSRLRAREQTLQDAMSRLALGVIEVNMDGQLRYCSEMAQRMLDQHPGVTISEGRLRVCDSAQHKALLELIDEALADIPERRKRNLAMGIEHGDRAHPLVVMVAPAATPGAVNLYLSDP
ncbi:MAG: LuxR family transcriptional regulator [Alcanivoracaceae bacterium]|nr:LuxR family transcriptional regulator [Alcanivoracaceae bacterium]